MWRLGEIISQRYSFAKKIYRWGWKWMIFIIWGVPYGFAKFYAFLLSERFLPQQWPRISQVLHGWPLYLWIGIGVVLFIGITFEGAYRFAQKELQPNKDHSGLQNEISKVINQLSTIKINTANAQENYANMLIKCSKDLAVGGIAIDRSPPTVYTDVRGNVIPPARDRYGMTYYERLEFLRQLRIDGIIEPDYSGNYERFHLSEFGRQVVKNIRQTGHE